MEFTVDGKKGSYAYVQSKALIVTLLERIRELYFMMYATSPKVHILKFVKFFKTL